MDKTIPYFLWDYHLTQEQVKSILAGDNATDKSWLVSRILESARFEDVWKYISLDELKSIFPSLKIKPPIREAWTRALSVWQ